MTEIKIRDCAQVIYAQLLRNRGGRLKDAAAPVLDLAGYCYRIKNFRIRQLTIPAMHRGSSVVCKEPYTLNAPCTP